MILYCDKAENWQINIQDPATPAVDGMIFFHNYLLFFLITIGVSVCWFLIKIITHFNRKTNKIPKKFTHSNLLEVIWKILPALMLSVLLSDSWVFCEEGLTDFEKKTFSSQDRWDGACLFLGVTSAGVLFARVFMPWLLSSAQATIITGAQVNAVAVLTASGQDQAVPSTNNNNSETLKHSNTDVFSLDNISFGEAVSGDNLTPPGSEIFSCLEYYTDFFLVNYVFSYILLFGVILLILFILKKTNLRGMNVLI